jgi:hypothetical protein
MKFEKTWVYGLEPAIIGMRLPMSKNYEDALSKCDSFNMSDEDKLGESDKRIMHNLINADKKVGVCQPNSKFLQMIEVWVCIEAPLCFWKEFDTYRHAVKNSTSTMHKIQSYPINDSCFERNPISGKISKLIHIDELEEYRNKYNDYSELIKNSTSTDEISNLKKEQKDIWYDLIYGLGDSWLQTRMCHMNYATIQNMCTWRKNHKQNTWSGKDNTEMDNFYEWAKTLPYSELIV